VTLRYRTAKTGSLYLTKLVGLIRYRDMTENYHSWYALAHSAALVRRA